MRCRSAMVARSSSQESPRRRCAARATKNSKLKSRNCRDVLDRSSPPARKLTRAQLLKIRLRLELLLDHAREQYLKTFVEDAWSILEPTTPLQWNWHLDLLCDYLTAARYGECRRLIINVPP